MKILYTILFFFSFEIKVSAINYNVWQEEKVNDLTLTYDEIKMYKWYKEEIKGEYLLYDITLDKYPYNNLDNQIKGDFSPWDTTCIKSDYREIEYKEIYEYQKVKDILYIKLENISKDTNINNILIKSNNNLIKYEIVNSYNYLNNNIKNSGYIILKLDNYYDISNISFYINTNEDKFFSIFIYNDISNIKNYLLNYTIISNTNYDISKFNINKNNDIYTSITTENIINEDKFTKKTNHYQICRYRDILTYHYDIIKTYYDDNYHINISNYIKDEKTLKTFYKYYYIEGKNNLEENDHKTINNKINVSTKNNIHLNENIKTINKNNKNKITKYIIIFLIISTTIYIIKKCRMN